MSQTAVSTTASTTMAPVIAVNRVHTSHVPNPDFIPPADYKLPENFQQVTINPKGPTQVPLKTARDYSKEEYKYSDFLPYNTLTSEDPLTPYDHTDASSRADPEKKSLFDAIPSRKDMTPNIGTEVRGVQLSELSNQQRDELALYVAERGLVIFREQDFVDLGIQWLMEFGSYFGRLHTHQFGVHPKNHPELTVVFRDMDKGNYFDNQAGGSLNTLSWHTDMSYEHNPPCTTFLSSLDGPECGGDTLYVNCMTAYDRLSPTMQTFLESLTAVHSGKRQNLLSNKTNLARRPGIDTVHPVIRKHPITGRKCLWVNQEYTTHIVGLKKQESDALLNMLFDHIHKGLDFQTRAKWEKGSVVVYDNRMVQHSVTLDYPLGNGEKRHLVRVTPQGEEPSL